MLISHIKNRNIFQKWWNSCVSHVAFFAFVFLALSFPFSFASAAGEKVLEVQVRFNEDQGAIWTHNDNAIDKGVFISFEETCPGCQLIEPLQYRDDTSPIFQDNRWYIPQYGFLKFRVPDAVQNVQVNLFDEPGNEVVFEDQGDTQRTRFSRDVFFLEDEPNKTAIFYVTKDKNFQRLLSNAIPIGENSAESQFITNVGQFSRRATSLLGWMLQVNSEGFENEKIEELSIIIRDIVNGLVLLSLLVFALMWSFSALLPKDTLRKTMILLGISALVANFSFPMVKLILDGGSILQRSFLSEEISEDKFLKIQNITNVWVGKSVATMQPKVVRASGDEIDELNLLNERYVDINEESTYFYGGMILALSAGEILIAILLALRIVILWFFLILSPLFAVLPILPFMRGVFRYWLWIFGRWLAIGPLVAACIFASVTIWQYAGVPVESSFHSVAGVQFLANKTNIQMYAPGVVVSEGGNMATAMEVMKFIIGILMVWLSAIIPFWLTRSKLLVNPIITEKKAKAVTAPKKKSSPIDSTPPKDPSPMESLVRKISPISSGSPLFGEKTSTDAPTPTPQTLTFSDSGKKETLREKEKEASAPINVSSPDTDGLSFDVSSVNINTENPITVSAPVPDSSPPQEDAKKPEKQETNFEEEMKKIISAPEKQDTAVPDSLHVDAKASNDIQKEQTHDQRIEKETVKETSQSEKLKETEKQNTSEKITDQKSTTATNEHKRDIRSEVSESQRTDIRDSQSSQKEAMMQSEKSKEANITQNKEASTSSKITDAVHSEKASEMNTSEQHSIPRADTVNVEQDVSKHENISQTLSEEKSLPDQDETVFVDRSSPRSQQNAKVLHVDEEHTQQKDISEMKHSDTSISSSSPSSEEKQTSHTDFSSASEDGINHKKVSQTKKAAQVQDALLQELQGTQKSEERGTTSDIPQQKVTVAPQEESATDTEASASSKDTKQKISTSGDLPSLDDVPDQPSVKTEEKKTVVGGASSSPDIPSIPETPKKEAHHGDTSDQDVSSPSSAPSEQKHMGSTSENTASNDWANILNPSSPQGKTNVEVSPSSPEDEEIILSAETRKTTEKNTMTLEDEEIDDQRVHGNTLTSEEQVYDQAGEQSGTTGQDTSSTASDMQKNESPEKELDDEDEQPIFGEEEEEMRGEQAEVDDFNERHNALLEEIEEDEKKE